MNILLTSVGRRSYLVQYFKEAIGASGTVHVSNSSALTPAFMFADRSFVTPLIYDQDYIPCLLSYCQQNKIQALISLFDVDLQILAVNKARFTDIGVQVIVSDADVIDICNDKWKTYQLFIANGIKAPRTFISLSDAQEAIERGELQYPLIIKPRWGMGSIGVLQADHEQELHVLYHKSLTQILSTYLKYESSAMLDESVIIQEKLQGQEYGLDVINNLAGAYQNTVVKLKHAMRCGETDCAETVDDDQLSALGCTISGKLKHIGNLDVDVFLVDQVPYVLEMNARFGGGYPFSHIAGVRLPQAIVEWVKGNEVPSSWFRARSGVLSHKDIQIVQIMQTE